MAATSPSGSALFIYNAFLYAVLRRRDYLLYLIYISTIAAFLVTGSGASTSVMGWPLWPLRGMLEQILLNLTSFTSRPVQPGLSRHTGEVAGGRSVAESRTIGS